MIYFGHSCFEVIGHVIISVFRPINITENDVAQGVREILSHEPVVDIAINGLIKHYLPNNLKGILKIGQMWDLSIVLNDFDRTKPTSIIRCLLQRHLYGAM